MAINILAGAAKALEQMVKTHIGCKDPFGGAKLDAAVRGHLLSAVDIESPNSWAAKAVCEALAGATGKMAAVRRLPGNGYRVEYATVEIDQVANLISSVPA